MATTSTIDQPGAGSAGVAATGLPDPASIDRGRIRLARLMLAATVASQALGVLVYWRGWSEHVPIGYGADLPALLSADLFGLAAAIVGLVILTSRPGNLIGRLLAITGLGVSAIVLAMFAAAAGMARGAEPLSTLLGWLGGSLLQPGAAGMLALIMLVFPTGGLVSARWRPAIVAIALGSALRFAETAFGAGPVYYFPTIPNPYAAAGLAGDVATWSRDHSIGLWVLLAGFVLGAGSLFARYRDAPRDVRRQIRWFVVAGGAAILAAGPLMYAFLFIDPALGVGQEFWVGYFVVSTVHPVAVGIAITRYRLYEIDRIVNRAIVYGSLTAILAGVFAASISLSQRIFVALTGESSDAAIVLTTLAVTTAYTPVRRRLETFVDRRFKFQAARFGPLRAQIDAALEVTEPEAAGRRLLADAVRELGAAGGALHLRRAGRLELITTAGRWEPGGNVLRVPFGIGAGAGGAPCGEVALVLDPDREGYVERGVADLRTVADLLGRSLRPRDVEGPVAPRASRGRSARRAKASG